MPDAQNEMALLISSSSRRNDIHVLLEGSTEADHLPSQSVASPEKVGSTVT